MGIQKAGVMSGAELQHFIGHLLNDVRALEFMLDNDWFETDTIRIGAEQEMCLIDNKTFRPASINMQVLERMTDSPWCVTELAKFNLENNLQPQVFSGKALSLMEEENNRYLSLIQQQLKDFDAQILLTGILPTLRKNDLGLHNLTPKERYFALVEAINSSLQKNTIEFKLDGIDELCISHDSPLIEACNTSFQVHLQVTPKDFVPLYNIAQTLAAPTIAIAANSPLVFGKRLWHESRIALFQQALDTRSSNDHMRERSPRVNFGKGWLKNSILEIYKEDISRFRVLLGGEVDENSLDMIKAGKVPKLRALQMHNSSVYRWNRPCYGISDNGKPHLRIENRVLASGPTVVDEMANAAFWLGAMVGIHEQYGDITKLLSYEDIRDNFDKACKFGIDSKFNWFKDSKISAVDLVQHELIPLAKEGLAKQNIDKADIKKYMDIIEGRAKKQMNGARWMLRAFSKLKQQTTVDEAITVMTAVMVKNQNESKPVHTWAEPTLQDLQEYRPSHLRVEEFMETDLFTVQKDDIIELVAEMMNWRKIRYMPVEDTKGNLIGLVTSRILLRHYTQKEAIIGTTKTTVKDIMIEKPITISPEATIMEALNLLRNNKIGCLPVVKNKELIGIITEMDFLRITGRLLDRLEK